MKLNPESCYQAVLTHDPRFDGVFFVGIATTGIYCRTVCSARRPRRENCTFYPSAAAAERAGYRPCLRCRPEMAPGRARADAVGRLAAAAAARIEDGALTEGSVGSLASEMGVTDRHLRRALRSEFGVAPIELAQTQRLLFARRLLRDTTLPITEVAYVSGFSSVRRFNALFHARYRTNPTTLRKSQTPAAQTGTLICELSFRPPLNWDAMLDFLSDRALPGVEWVDRDSYYRTVALREHRGWIAVSRSSTRYALRVELSASLAPALPPLLARLRRLFDLGADPELIAERLGGLAIDDPGMRLPGAFSGFETAVRAIIGQQISVRAANTLAGRLVESMGAPIESPFPALTRLSPTAERIARATPGEISAIGIVTSRANAIIALANAVIDRSLSFGPGVNIERTMARLKQIPGVGDWTAEYIAMRALSWPDAFPHTDLGIRKALGETNPARVLEMAEAWRPWRSYAVIRLWRSLKPLSPDTGSAM